MVRQDIALWQCI